MHFWQICFKQGANSTLGEKIVFSVNGDGQTGYPHEEEWNQAFSSHHIQKNQLKMDYRIKCKTKNYDTRWQNTGEMLQIHFIFHVPICK